MKRFRASDGFIGFFLAIQLLLPLRYYLFDRGTDERFSWRMFSSTRLARCTFDLEADGEPIELRRTLGVSPYTVDLIPKGDPDVVLGFMRWWCERDRVTEVRYRNRCEHVDGSIAPPRSASLRCGDGTLDLEGNW